MNRNNWLELYRDYRNLRSTYYGIYQPVKGLYDEEAWNRAGQVALQFFIPYDTLLSRALGIEEQL